MAPKRKPDYGQHFEHPIFKGERKYIRYADDHMRIYELWRSSDVIDYEVVETVTPLEIPVVYHIHYNLRTITGVDDFRLPIYGNTHILKLSIKHDYPTKSPKAYMITPVWHPNIKWDGPYKGRVCVNSKGFGVEFSLDMIVLRIGEILQYKNYLAEFRYPYPEDENVAAWVREIGEPQRIIDKKNKLFTDDVPLMREDGTKKDLELPPEEPKAPKIIIKKKPSEEADKDNTSNTGKSKIIIGKDKPKT